jgi:hypothetical protein
MADGRDRRTVHGMSMPLPSGPMPGVSGDLSGTSTPSMHTLGVGAWASEIQMLRILKAVSDVTDVPLQVLAVKRRTHTLAEIAAEAGVTRDALIAVIAAALRSGEPIGGVWHQHDTALREATRLVDERPGKKTPRPVEEPRDEQPPKQQPQRPPHKDDRDEHGFDREGHLDIRA